MIKEHWVRIFAFVFLFISFSAQARRACLDDMLTLISKQDMFWKSTSRRFNQVASTTLSNNRTVYMQGLEVGDENLKFLEDLGFIFDEDQVIVPNLNIILDGLNRKYTELVDSGAIASNEVLIPAFPVKNAEGSVFPVPFGTAIPEGFEPLAEETILHPNSFMNFIRAGFFPIGRIDAIVDNSTLMLVHDLGHFGSFIQNPEYLRLVNQTAQILEGHRLSHLGKLAARTNYINEGLIWVKPTEMENVSRILNRVYPDRDAPGTQMDYYVKLLQLSDEELVDLANDVIANIDKYLRYYGGTVRDTVYRHIHREDETISKFLMIKHFLETADHNEQLYQLLSRHFAVLDHMSSMSMDDLLDLIRYEDLPEDSNAFKLFCASGVYDGHPTFQKFCP